jgi:hypothetical protein
MMDTMRAWGAELTIQQRVEDEPPVLLYQVVDIAEDAAGSLSVT